MNKKILLDLDICINNVLTSDLGSDPKYVEAIRKSIEGLITEYDLYMVTLEGMSGHLSETQRDLLALVIDEFDLTHKPKLEKLYNLVKNVENSFLNTKPTIH